ncbi:MAG: HAMP domain-containing sensor histidine kinase [Candidatus Dormiibacterota bacterium]
MRRRLSYVAASSARVALITTAIVAVLYIVVAASVVTIVQRSLTDQIDGELALTLAHIDAPPPPHGDPQPPGPGPGDHRFGPPKLIWTVSQNGTVSSSDRQAVLPANCHRLVGPETITVGGTEMRAQGKSVGNVHVIAATSMESVNQTRWTLIVAESIVGPLLLLAVFLGALTIGRRVAAPIELARRRQMEFTADASHELRTPLSVIEALTSLATRSERDVEWYRKAFTSVHKESERIRHLVEDLLWLARFDSTERHEHPEPTDLGVLAAEAVDRFAVRAEAKGLTLTLDRPSQPAVITAPPAWLDRLLGVLLDNACKYAPEHGEVHVRIATDRSQLELAVDDSGPGIPLEELDHIFDRFHRATERASGAGLGLAIADAVVRSTGGHWRIARSPQGGASMSITWHRS